MLPVVRKAEQAISKDDSLNHEYLGQLGLDKFSQLATQMLLGEDSAVLKDSKVWAALDMVVNKVDHTWIGCRLLAFNVCRALALCVLVGIS